jgi:NTP pyrophosphatase (non-canonical NTP hydrolase)
MSAMTIAEFQRLIEAIYYERDRARGIPGTFLWFAEEVGELARALKRNDRENLAHEFADVFAWLSTLASLSGIEMSEVIEKYARGCPRCRGTPCTCH